MTAITLTRHDRSRNMARFYRLDVQPDLFGGWTVWREWGRIGAGGTVRHDAFSTREAADAAQARLAAAKTRRGYGNAANPSLFLGLTESRDGPRLALHHGKVLPARRTV